MSIHFSIGSLLFPRPIERQGVLAVSVLNSSVTIWCHLSTVHHYTMNVSWLEVKSNFGQLIFVLSFCLTYNNGCITCSGPRWFIHPPFAAFVRSHCPNFHLSFNLSVRAVIKWHGIGGRTGAKSIQRDLHVFKSFQPDIVILQVASNMLV